jgi:hypothetical protein
MTVKKLSALLVAAAVGLSGCVGARMDRALDRLEGQPVQMAFAKFGPPDQEQTVSGGKIYSWVVDEVGPAGQTAVQYACRVRVASDNDNIVRSSDWRGDALGCKKLLTHRR